MTRLEIEAIIAKMDPGLDRDEEAFKAQLVMFASADQNTMDVRKLAKFTGVSYGLVAKFAHNLRKGGVWQGRKIYAEWAEEDGGIAFMMDSMVAMGLLERAH